MKFTIETEDELEMKRILAVKDCLYVLSQIQLLCHDADEVKASEILDTISDIDLDTLWS